MTTQHKGPHQRRRMISKVEQDYRRPAWARETQRPYWNNADPMKGLHYEQPISTTPRVQPEYLYFPTLREIQLRYKASAKQYETFASCTDPSRNAG